MRERIKEIANGLDVSQNKRELCPACSGGKSKERSLSVTRLDSGILYYCFRASCGAKGFVRDFKTRRNDFHQERRKYPRYTGGLRNLSAKEIWEFFGKYSLAQHDITQNGIRRTTNGRWLYFPIFNYRALQIGEQLKRVDNQPGAKAVTFRWTQDSLLYFPVGSGYSRRIVVVEDPISAIKVSKLETTTALLGVSIGEDTPVLFNMLRIEKIVIMCDGDSAGRVATIGIKDKLAPFFDTTAVFLDSGKDPKDLSYKQLKEILDG